MRMTFPSNRFGERVTVEGITYRSKLEAQVASRLPPGCQYECRKVFYITEHAYTPDFELPNGVFLEVKGFWAPEDRSKIKAVLKHNPDMDIRMVFQRPQCRINRKSRTTYADWCDKHGIPWCSADAIPDPWFEPDAKRST